MNRVDNRHVPVAVGDVIGGRYRVEAVLGQGGMAIVYQARHTATGRPCALKLVHAHLVTNPQLIDLFVKETQVGARVGKNANIVDVLDAGVDETRRLPFLAMDLLEGETLEQYLESNGPPPIPLLREVLDQLADALDQAHAAGVVHRDLKPSNLFLTYDRKKRPHLKVLDFGIAKVLELEAQRTATQVGTPAYAAPEQMGPTLRKIAERQRIRIATGVSPATDIWALGLIAYEFLTALPTGQYWGVEAITELPTKVVLDEHEPASRRAGQRAQLLPTGFDAWFARCLDKDAERRWPSVRRAVDELLALLPTASAPMTSQHTVGTPAPGIPSSAPTVPMTPNLTQLSDAKTVPVPFNTAQSGTRGVVFAAIAMAILLATTGVVVYRLNERHVAELAAREEQERQAEETRRRLEAEIKEQNAKIDRLLADLTSARDEVQRTAILKQLEEAKAAKEKLKNGAPRGNPSTGSGGPAKSCNCVAGDPLCSCL